LVTIIVTQKLIKISKKTSTKVTSMAVNLFLEVIMREYCNISTTPKGFQKKKKTFVKLIHSSLHSESKTFQSPSHTKFAEHPSVRYYNIMCYNIYKGSC